jgi:hypothetical protein
MQRMENGPQRIMRLDARRLNAVLRRLGHQRILTPAWHATDTDCSSAPTARPNLYSP